MPGIVMGALSLVQFLVNFVTLKNLSKDYNLKKEQTEHSFTSKHHQEDTDEETEDEFHISGDEDFPLVKADEQNLLQITHGTPNEGSDGIVRSSGSKEKYLIALKTILRNQEVIFLYLLSFFTSYCRATIRLLIPIKAILYLKWTQTDISILYIISTFAGAIPMAIALGLLSKFTEDVYLLISTLVQLLVALILMAVIPIVEDNSAIVSFLLYATALLIWMSGTGFQIMSRSMLAKFVPENIQTVSEAIRNSLFELSYLMAGLCVELPDTYMATYMLVLSVFTVFVLSWLLVNTNKFKEIRIIQVVGP